MDSKTKSSRYLSWLLFLPLVSAESIAQAQQTAREEVIVTASRVPEEVEQLIGNAAVLDATTLQAVDHQHIQQVLVRLPGVNYQRGSGQESLPAIRSPVLTGTGACGSVLIAEDGIPVRPAGFCNINELFEAHTEQAQKIEVLRGPATVAYGSNAMHGVMNVIAPAAFDQPAELALEGGSDDYARLKARASSTNLAASLTVDHDGGWRDDAATEQQKMSLRYRWQGSAISVTGGLTAVNLNQETAGFIEGFEAYKDADVAASNFNPEAYRDAHAVRLWTRVEGDGWIVTPYWRQSRMQFLQHFLPGQPVEKNGQWSVGAQSLRYWDTDSSRLSVGFDAEWVDGWLRQEQASATEGSAFLVETIPAGTQYDFDIEALQLAAFTQWQMNLSARWLVDFELRYEWLEYDYDNLMLDGRTREDGSACGFGGCRYTRPGDRRDRFDNLSYRAGLAYQLTPAQQLFTNAARGFRVPQAAELYRLQGEQEVADLDAETIDSIELGWRLRQPDWQLEWTAFWMDKKHVIFRDSDFFNRSGGETDHLGTELSLSYQLAPTLDVALAASLARHRYANNVTEVAGIKGNDVDTAPRHFGSAQLGWQPLAELRLELEWLHMGSYYTDPENQHQYDGHDIANLRSDWQLNQHWQLSAQVLNVFDSAYAERADYTSFSGDRYFPGQPRSYYMTVQYRFN